MFWCEVVQKTDDEWQAVLNEYRNYAQAWGQQNPTAWTAIEPLVNLRVGQILKDATPTARKKLGGLVGWLIEKSSGIW